MATQKKEKTETLNKLHYYVTISGHNRKGHGAIKVHCPMCGETAVSYDPYNIAPVKHEDGCKFEEYNK